MQQTKKSSPSSAFFSGMAMALDLGATLSRRTVVVDKPELRLKNRYTGKNGFQSDYEALCGDWQKVDSYISTAMEGYHCEINKNTKGEI